MEKPLPLAKRKVKRHGEHRSSQSGTLQRAGKLSNFIKEIKQGRDRPKAGKKEVLTKDKSMTIYMIQHGTE
ncbi:hypothetical protein Tco_0477008, partial [Tanacetum coccineum]